MNDTRKGLLLLIKSAITGEKCDLPDNLNYHKICLEAKQRGVATLAYYGAYNSGLKVNSEPFLDLLAFVYSAIRLSEKQLFEVERIESIFKAKSIEYMLLKGAELKFIYPKSEMRSMSDIDILIKLEQYSEIKTIMQELGYEHVVESDHELIWTGAAACASRSWACRVSTAPRKAITGWVLGTRILPRRWV